MLEIDPTAGTTQRGAKATKAKKTIKKSAAPAKVAPAAGDVKDVYVVLKYTCEVPVGSEQWTNGEEATEGGEKIVGIYTTAAAANAKALSGFLEIGWNPAVVRKVKAAAKAMKFVALESWKYDDEAPMVMDGSTVRIRVEKHKLRTA